MTNVPIGSGTKLPNLPHVNVADPQLRPVVDAIKTIFNTRAFNKDPLERWVTWRDLVENNLVVYSSGGSNYVGGGSGSGFLPLPSGQDDFTPPPAPSGLTIDGAFNNIILDWDDPTDSYSNHAFTEIWRSATNDIGTATLIGTARGLVYADAVGNNNSYYYWIRFVSTANVTGPYNSLVGTLGQTALDPGYLLSTLAGAITESQLFSSLGERISLIDAPETTPNSVAARILAEATARAQGLLDEAAARQLAIDTETLARTQAINAEAQARADALLAEAAQRQADISTEATTRQTADESLSSQITTLTSSLDTVNSTLTAAIQSEATARANAVSAEAAARDTLAAQMRGDYAGGDISQVTSGFIFTERQARVTADAALSTRIDTLVAASSGDFQDLFAAITQEETARISADEVNATSISTLQTRMDNLAGAGGLPTNKSLEATISDNRDAQVDGDTALATSITTLSSTVDSNYTTLNSAITTEATTRATEIASEATARSTLATQMRGNYEGTDLSLLTSGLIHSEYTSRVTADESLQTQINTLSASAASDYATLLSAIETEQIARATADSSEATSRQTLATQMRGNYEGTDLAGLTTGLLYSEQQARSDADTALSTSITALSSTVDTNFTTLNAAIVTESTTRASAVDALSTQVSTVAAQSTKSRSYRQDEAPTEGMIEGDLWFDTNDNNKAYRYSGTAWVATDDTRLEANAVAIQTEATARVAADDSLFAQYTVKIDANGYVSGFGLASTVNNSVPFSDFIIRADRFSIASPEGPGLTPIVPFVVNTTAQTINGVNVPAGVYIDAAYIKNGTITNAKIGSAAIDSAKIADAAISSAKIENAAITGAKIANATITGAKIATATITSALIQDAAIGTAKIADAAITNAKISTLDAGKITTGTLDAGRIGAGSIDAGKIDSRNLTIKDASGNILFGAGNALDWTSISSSYPDAVANMSINYATSELWVYDESNSNAPGKFGGDFTVNGDGNQRIYSTDPFGKNNWVWRSIGNDTSSDADGGWNKNITGLVSSKGYVSYVYVRRRSSSANGNFYHGCGQENNTLNLDGTVNNNPYFGAFDINTLELDEWYLSYGVIQPYTGVTVPSSGVGGLYKLKTGEKVVAYSDYKMASGATTQAHRTYLYYSTNPSTIVEWSSPGFFKMDGSEPSWSDLLTVGMVGAISTTNPITSSNISTYISAAAIGSAYIANASITNAKIANLAVTGAKIASASITNAKIGTAAVDTLKIDNNAVTVTASATGPQGTEVWITTNYGGVIVFVMRTEKADFDNTSTLVVNGGTYYSYSGNKVLVGYTSAGDGGDTSIYEWTPATGVYRLEVGPGTFRCQLFTYTSCTLVALLTQR